MTKLNKYIIYSLVLLGLLLFGIAKAAPTSTRVQNLFITDLSSTGNPCLIIGATGLVSTSTSCGSGGSGSATTTINQVVGPVFTFTTSTGVSIWNISTSTGVVDFKIPSNVGFFSNDKNYVTSSSISGISPIVWGSATGSISCPTCISQTNIGGVSGQLLFFSNPTFATSSLSLMFTTSTGVFAVGTTSTFTGLFTQSGGLATLASTTINGQTTTTNLTITSITGTQCLRATNGVVSGIGSDCGSGTLSGNGTSTNISFYDGATTLTSNDLFRFNPSNFALELSATGTNNMFIGNHSGFSIHANGTENTFIGESAGSSTTSGDANVFLGAFSGSSNITGSDNMFIGSYSGNLNETGIRNIYIGTESGESNNSDNNTFIGNRAGLNLTKGNDNIMIGRSSGNPLIDGTLNIYIGNLSGAVNTTGTNNIVIGHNTTLADTTSNALIIGNGLTINTSSTGVIGDVGFKLGIATTSPIATLDVYGSFNQGNGFSTIASTTISGILATNTLNVTSTSVFGSQVTGVGSAWSGILSGTNINATTSLFSASSTLLTQLTIPKNATLNANGQLSVDTNSSTLSFYSGAAVQRLNPEQCNIDFVLEVASSSGQVQEDDYLHTFGSTSTITRMFSTHKNATSGDTATFNLIWGTNRTLASSSAQHLFSGAGTGGNVTSTSGVTPDIYPNLVSFASTTVPIGSVMRLVTTKVSSTQWGITVCYRENY